MGNIASEFTFYHWKVVFSWGIVRKSLFSQNPLKSRFSSFGFLIYILSCGNFKKNPPWWISILHVPATGGPFARLKEVHKVDQLQLILKFFLGRASSDYDLTLHVVLHVTFWYLSSKSKVWKKGGCWYISQMDPSTLDAFSVELTHPLQKLWEKIMDKDKHKDSTVAIWQRHVFAGGIFF